MDRPGVARFQCPHCLGMHPVQATKECPTEHLPIPADYILDQSRNNPVLNMLTIGYQNHGKTCYLASLINSFYQLCRIWQPDGFSFRGLDEATLAKVWKTYVAPLQSGNLPPGTRDFPHMMLELTGIPYVQVRDGLRLPGPRRMLLNILDVPGETFTDQAVIQGKLASLTRLRNIVLLVDLSAVQADSGGFSGEEDRRIHELVSRLTNALGELDAVAGRTSRGIVVCFTKADTLWGKPDFGPLAERRPSGLPAAGGLAVYVQKVGARSRDIGVWASKRYPVTTALLSGQFSAVTFASSSATGTQPSRNESDGTQSVGAVNPEGVLDPLLCLMKMEGLL